jgi:hypothetical protein
MPSFLAILFPGFPTKLDENIPVANSLMYLISHYMFQQKFALLESLTHTGHA